MRYSAYRRILRPCDCAAKIHQPPAYATFKSPQLTFGEVTGRDLLGVVGEVRQRGILLPFPDHQMDNDQGLEYNGPRGVAKSVLECSKYLCDARFAGMGRHQDRLDVFRFRGRKLRANRGQYPHGPEVFHWRPVLTLSLVAPLTDFSKLVIVSGVVG